jgi:hypothetical protein
LEIETLYIEPGSPWENGYAESFHSRLRDEFLATEVFESLSAARKLTAAWREDYNHHRPHSSLGYVAPTEFAVNYVPLYELYCSPKPIARAFLCHSIKQIMRPTAFFYIFAVGITIYLSNFTSPISVASIFRRTPN